MSDRITELLNLELDGRLDAGQRAELDALVAGDPAIAARRDSLRAVARALAAAPLEEPPAGFADAVIAKAGWRKPRGRARMWRTGLALAASVAAAMVLLRVVDTDLEGQNLSATLAPVAAPIATLTTLDDGVVSLALELPGAPAELVIDCGAGAALRASATQPLRILGRRIVVPAAAGSVAVEIAGASDITANVIRDGAVIPVTIRSP